VRWVIPSNLGAAAAGAKPKTPGQETGILDGKTGPLGYPVGVPPDEDGAHGQRTRIKSINNSQPMKTLRVFSAVLGLIAACALRAADTSSPPSRVDVVFDHPDKFTDVKDSEPPTDRGRDAILGAIRAYLVSRASPMIPEGDKLTITFTDIDLAGEFEPWRGPMWSSVRIIKDIYPPAFKFTYAVTDPSGRVVRGGTENIRDGGFQYRGTTIDSTDTLRYEKEVLSDWMRSTLRDVK
jgi:hypothetical protein